MPRSRVTASGVVVTTTAETVIATLPGITLQAGNVVDLLATLDFTSGTAATAVQYNIRRGTLVTGTLVSNVGLFVVTAGQRTTVTIAATDVQNVDVANQQYVLTAVQTAATGNGTANGAILRADY